MQAYASKKLGADIIYLSPMHITQRAISGHDIPNTHPSLMNLDHLQRVEVRVKMRGGIMYKKGQYILKAIKMVQGNGYVLAAHQFR